MKKLLSILSAVSLTVTGASSIVACKKPEKTKDINKQTNKQNLSKLITTPNLGDITMASATPTTDELETAIKAKNTNYQNGDVTFSEIKATEATVTGATNKYTGTVKLSYTKKVVLSPLNSFITETDLGDITMASATPTTDELETAIKAKNTNYQNGDVTFSEIKATEATVTGVTNKYTGTVKLSYTKKVVLSPLNSFITETDLGDITMASATPTTDELETAIKAKNTNYQNGDVTFSEIKATEATVTGATNKYTGTVKLSYTKKVVLSPLNSFITETDLGDITMASATPTTDELETAIKAKNTNYQNGDVTFSEIKATEATVTGATNKYTGTVKLSYTKKVVLSPLNSFITETDLGDITMASATPTTDELETAIKAKNTNYQNGDVTFSEIKATEATLTGATNKYTGTVKLSYTKKVVLSPLNSVITTPDLGDITMASATPTTDEIETAIKAKNTNYQNGDVTFSEIKATEATVTGATNKYTGTVKLSYTKKVVLSPLNSVITTPDLGDITMASATPTTDELETAIKAKNTNYQNGDVTFSEIKATEATVTGATNKYTGTVKLSYTKKVVLSPLNSVITTPDLGDITMASATPTTDELETAIKAKNTNYQNGDVTFSEIKATEATVTGVTNKYTGTVKLSYTKKVVLSPLNSFITETDLGDITMASATPTTDELETAIKAKNTNYQNGDVTFSEIKATEATVTGATNKYTGTVKLSYTKKVVLSPLNSVITTPDLGDITMASATPTTDELETAIKAKNTNYQNGDVTFTEIKVTEATVTGATNKYTGTVKLSYTKKVVLSPLNSVITTPDLGDITMASATPTTDELETAIKAKNTNYQNGDVTFSEIKATEATVTGATNKYTGTVKLSYTKKVVLSPLNSVITTPDLGDITMASATPTTDELETAIKAKNTNYQNGDVTFSEIKATEATLTGATNKYTGTVKLSYTKKVVLSPLNSVITTPDLGDITMASATPTTDELETAIKAKNTKYQNGDVTFTEIKVTEATVTGATNKYTGTVKLSYTKKVVLSPLNSVITTPDLGDITMASATPTTDELETAIKAKNTNYQNGDVTFTEIKVTEATVTGATNKYTGTVKLSYTKKVVLSPLNSVITTPDLGDITMASATPTTDELETAIKAKNTNYQNGDVTFTEIKVTEATVTGATNKYTGTVKLSYTKKVVLSPLNSVITTPDLGDITMASATPTTDELETAIKAKNTKYQNGDVTFSEIKATEATVTGATNKYTGTVKLSYTKS
ncbi:hypothetical protein SKUN_001740 (plasmid) [Spiroplasma kunkelii CR2-3x]|uniref:Lipoprotein n=1 Tax=Spiroplasma kunkelii CR2-3x TaxID=273035 RepID=A0A0K2JJZ5_SPIKU|nr:lipoprotein [Spiroplasma kunkelii]ALA98591.1 hypothetical protein SKUN_001740 [Spiroplasma kunkelii CR2-3x]